MLKKNNKGFTLVELIVVIAIIAILAAIIVPTTLHYVDKANISKEIQQMNSSDSIQTIFTNAKFSNIDITNTTDDEDKKFVPLLQDLKLPYQYLGKIEIKIIGETDNWKVELILKGQEYGDKKNGSVLSAVLIPTFRDNELFNGSKEVPVKTQTYVFSINKETGDIIRTK